jgi:hypothetical protein
MSEYFAMTRHGSFHPLLREFATDEPVLFALVLDTPAQRGALQDEALSRATAIHHLSETLVTARLEAPDARSHGAILEAVAILSRDICGLLAASAHPGP